MKNFLYCATKVLYNVAVFTFLSHILTVLGNTALKNGNKKNGNKKIQCVVVHS